MARARVAVLCAALAPAVAIAAAGCQPADVVELRLVATRSLELPRDLPDGVWLRFRDAETREMVLERRLDGLAMANGAVETDGPEALEPRRRYEVTVRGDSAACRTGSAVGRSVAF